MKRNPAIPSEPIRKAAKIRSLLEDFPLIAQRTGWTCGPAVASAVAGYFGVKCSEKSTAAWMGTTKKYGTKPVDMAFFLSNLAGLKIQMRRRTPLFTVKAAVKRGHPVIVLWNDWKGHWAVIIGYDQGHFLLADPANKKSGMRFHKVKNFRKHWHATVDGDKYTQLAIICKP
jgi:ABC-type bacteriocin/lantibiotic exporter with double-glycine peptidase domain